MKKILIILCLLLAAFLMAPEKSWCQKADAKRLEQSIGLAYKKAYPACVQLYAYDTIGKQQAGGVFSGVIVSKDGYILTAAHVAAPGVVYKVSFADGKTCLAVGLGKIILADDKTIPDAAMAKIITPGAWPFAEVGSSSALKLYEPCISISYPESLGQPKPILRFGYISDVKNGRGFIKSTCSMEPGDSGGPLFDCLGRVIGIHSAIEIPEESNYDIPADTYKKYWTALTLPRVYTAYPDVKDSIPSDPFAAGNLSMPGLVKNKLFMGAAAKLSSNCVMILSSLQGKAQKVNGTLFSFSDAIQVQGTHQILIVSKNSLVGDSVRIICIGHRPIKARVLLRDKENDLVLLEPANDIKGGISYKQLTAAKLNEVQAGIFLLSPQQDTTAAVSISGSPVFTVRKISGTGFLGIGFKNRALPLNVSYVFPNLNKSIYQLKIGDEITAINGQFAGDFNGVLQQLNHYWPGDTVSVQLKRSDSLLTRTIILDTLPQRHFNHPAELFAGGKSLRRDGFKSVFTHDAVLHPDRCGGPVFDLNGNFYGINIARFSRASCLALPAVVIYDFISRSLPGKITAGVFTN